MPEADAFDLPDLAAREKEEAIWFQRNDHYRLNEPPIISTPISRKGGTN